MDLKQFLFPVTWQYFIDKSGKVSDEWMKTVKGVIVVEGTPEEVFSSDNERMKSFLGKFYD